jgi:hypothetical protein
MLALIDSHAQDMTKPATKKISSGKRWVPLLTLQIILLARLQFPKKT